MKPDRKILLLLFFILELLAPGDSFAGKTVLTVPGHPIVLVCEHEKGQIVSSFLRTPEGLHQVKDLEGLILRKDDYLLPFADGDMLPDLIWKIELQDPDRGRNVLFWITSLTETPRAWLAMTPVSPTLWDSVPFHITVPRDVFLYVSPFLPGYGGRSSLEGKEFLTFVYTIGLTAEGPSFVLAPDVYRQLLLVTNLVRNGELDDNLRDSYSQLYRDFGRMAAGQMPSREAVQNFSWKKILSLGWKR